MSEKTETLAVTFTCFALTFFAAFKCSSFLLTALVCILQVLSCFWLVSLHDLKVEAKSNRWVVVCFGFGTGCTVLGVFLLLSEDYLGLFSVLYTVGTVSLLASILLLLEHLSNFEKFAGKDDKTITQGISTKSESLSEWWRTEIVDLVASNWGLITDVYHSDIGGILEGLCALLLPILGFLLFVGKVFIALGGLRRLGLEGLGGLEELLVPTQTKPGADQKQTDGGEKGETVEIKHKVMEVLRNSILFFGVWHWGFALMLWISECLFWGVFYSLRHFPRNVVDFVVCFTFGAGCTFLGVYLLDQHESGLILFRVFHLVGNVCVLGSTFFVMDPRNQLKTMFEDSRALATYVMLACLVLTLFTAWWKSFLLTLLFCLFHVMSCIWYFATYLPTASEAEKKKM